MSSTIIYKIGQDKISREYDAVHNSWRSAPAIWNYLEEKYLPLYRDACKYTNWYSDSLSDEDVINLNGFKPTRMGASLFNTAPMQEIFNLVDKKEIPDVDRICLYTTFDDVVVKREYLPTVIWAFEHFGGKSSLKEQARILRKLYEDKDCYGVAWCQTDCGDSGFDSCDEGGDSTGYNIEKNPSGKEIWYMFEGEELPELLGAENKVL